MKRSWPVVLVLACAMAFTDCSTNPATGDAFARVEPPRGELAAERGRRHQ